jgi:V/A-type H+-transporting ATPase subunit F
MALLKAAMIGDWSSVVGFKALGVETYDLTSPADAAALWDSLPLGSYAVIMLTEPVYKELRERMPGFPLHEGMPVVLPIPSVTGSLGLAKMVMRARVIKALGSVVD